MNRQLYYYQFAIFIIDAELNIARIKLKHKRASSADYRCRLCGKPFASFAEMQRHELVKHVQEGDLDKKSD
jgi:hypothetical protein